MNTNTATVIDVDEVLPINHYRNQIIRIAASIRKAVIGQEEMVWALLVAVLTGRPVALTGVPGVAKSHGAKALAHSLGFAESFGRIQCTNDKLPADFTGYNWFNQATGEWELLKGPLFKQVVFLDELNRASGKSLSGIMEGIEEGTVTIDGVTYALMQGQVIVATWNPAEHAGTEKLPDAIRGRFEACVVIGYPSEQDEYLIAKGDHEDPAMLFPVSDLDISGLQAYTRRIMDNTSPDVVKYAVRLANYTRQSPCFSLGASPRSTKSLVRVAASIALIHGREAATIEDVRAAAKPVLRHRLEPSFEEGCFNPTAETELAYIDRCIEQMIAEVS